MLKINIGWSQKRLAQQIAFGLSDGNLERLPVAPIPIQGQDIKVDADFVIFYTKHNPDDFKKDFDSTIKQVIALPQGRMSGLKLDDNIPVLDIENTFYVTPVSGGKQVCFFIGLHEQSYTKLRNCQNLTFRARMIEGNGQNVEVNIFWGKNEQEMIEVLETMGLLK